MIEWRCSNGHMIGLVMDYGNYNCLLLVDPRSAELELIATISGGADVRCLVCGAQRTWRFGSDVLRHLRQHASLHIQEL